MDADIVLKNLEDHFNASGFNLVLSIDPEQYEQISQEDNSLDSIFPDAESIILVGFAGNKFWGIFQNFLASNPDFREKNVDLIDNYTVFKFTEASNILTNNGINHKYVYPFGENALEVNFVKLAELGGAGVPSLLGILLHPVYGSWISLRGAVISNLKLNTYDKPISGFAPCPSCSKPCITTCPAHTISKSGWNWEACMKFRISNVTCSESCASRLACPYGKEEQYASDQIQYHHQFVLKSVKEYFSS